MKYCQCTLEKRTQSSVNTVVSYIPQKYAKIDSFVKLRNENNEWENGWLVKSIGPPIDEELLPDRHQEIKAHRRATGDSLPKC